MRPQLSNPVRGIRKYPENHRERFLSSEEVQRLGKVLDAHLKDGGNIFVVAAIHLLILTGARLSEITTLCWDYVDLERGLLLLPDSKTGKKAIVLNAAARKVLEQLPRLNGNPYVICSHKEGQPLVNLHKPCGAFASALVSMMFASTTCATPSPRWPLAAAAPCRASALCSATPRCKPPSATPTSSSMTSAN